MILRPFEIAVYSIMFFALVMNFIKSIVIGDGLWVYLGLIIAWAALAIAERRRYRKLRIHHDECLEKNESRANAMLRQKDQEYAALKQKNVSICEEVCKLQDEVKFHRKNQAHLQARLIEAEGRKLIVKKGAGKEKSVVKKK